jgi:hypothetical protein
MHVTADAQGDMQGFDPTGTGFAHSSGEGSYYFY